MHFTNDDMKNQIIGNDGNVYELDVRGGKPHFDMEMEPESRVGVDYQLIVHTLEGDHLVSNGDWIITGVKGEKYPCKPDIFEMTYELVTDTD